MRYIIGIDEVGRAARKRASLAQRYIVGIDEVGRGSLAGPVAVAAVLLPQGVRLKVVGDRAKLRDSKRLTQAQRELWFEYLTAHPKISYAVARVYPRGIEKLNISRAANLAALNAFTRLSKTYNLSPKTYRIYLDGGLYIGNGAQPKNAKTIVRGDEKYTAVKIASIIAKVTRDRAMTRMAKKYPTYGFEIHKGYGTRAHMRAIRKHGVSEAHRLSFLKKLEE